MWQGLQTITDYKGKHSRELPSDTSLPDELNYFYARFEASNTETCMRASAEDCVIIRPVHHWGQASCHPGPLYQAVSKEGPKNPATLVIDCSLCYRTASGGRSAKSRSKRLLNSFYPQAIRLLNIKSNGYLDYMHPPSFTLLLLSYYLCISH
jgi:hypothetical protein